MVVCTPASHLRQQQCDAGGLLCMSYLNDVFVADAREFE